MSKDAGSQEADDGEQNLVRRGLLGALVGLGAAGLMQLTGTRKAEAVHEAEDLGLGLNNPTAGGTVGATTRLDAANLAGAGLYVTNNDTTIFALHTGVTAQATGTGFGVWGINQAGTGAGVVGQGAQVGIRGFSTSNGTGVKGVSNNGTNLGSDGTGSGDGVHGKSSSGRGVFGEANAGTGVSGNSFGGGMGVSGMSTGTAGINSIGVKGTAGQSTGIGVQGFIANSLPGVGVDGVTQNSGGTAVRGSWQCLGRGVYGHSSADTLDNGNGSGIGVRGKSGSGVGVKGESTSAPGVEGVSVSSLGVRGTSTNFVGVVGISTTNHGLYGFSNSVSGVALVGDNGAGGLAGVFNGRVEVYGSFQVFGVKNAVLKMPDGTNALVYCQESPEPYFEDFGRAQLVGGVANVPIERDFAALVAGVDYMVFCFPEGPCGGLYVSRRGPAGFEVRDPANSSVSFTYRIVTRRKDVEGKRFARVGNEGAQSVAAARASLGVGGGPAGNPPGLLPVNPPVLPIQPAPPLQNGPTQIGPTQPGGPTPPASPSDGRR